MAKRTLKPRKYTRPTKKTSRKVKRKGKGKRSRNNKLSFPKKTGKFIFTFLPVWAWKLSVGLWHAFDHERRTWIIISRVLISLFIFPFLWLGMIGLYSIAVIPATIYGMLAIYLWASHKFADKVGVEGFNAANPKNKKVR